MTVFEGIRYLFAGMPTRSFDILYNMHSFASFLRSARDLQPNDWSILVTPGSLCLDGVMYGGGFVQGGFVRRGFCPTFN